MLTRFAYFIDRLDCGPISMIGYITPDLIFAGHEE